jgi:hypothetical protein
MLLIGLIVALVTVVATMAFFLLVGVYLGIKGMRKDAKKKEDDDEGGIYTLPLSSLSGLGGGGGGRMPTQAEMDQVRAAIAQSRGGAAPAAPEDKKEAYMPGGYL